MKKLLKGLLILVLVLLLLVGAGLGYLTAIEFKPAPVEAVTLSPNGGGRALPQDELIELMSWNIGYAGLGAGSDFFMDGGENSRAADQFTVSEYLGGIHSTVYRGESRPSLILLQEVDRNSTRTYHMDETEVLAGQTAAFALNYSCPFVPIPMPPMGQVNSGLFTISQGYEITEAERISLPCPFSWPLRIANLKRCLLVSYLPVEGSDKQLVLVNLHLEAYDDGEGKIAQTKQLRDFIEQEYKKGNYVIAGGDFNQVFPGSLEVYPNTHPELWEVGTLTDDMLPEGFSFAYDTSTPTCRLLNQPYDPTDTVNTQYYVIDGFILSPNVELEEVTTLDEGFANSDHNPVRLRVYLRG